MTIYTLTTQQRDEDLSEYETHKFSAFASDLGRLAADGVAEALRVPGMGNGQLFLLTSLTEDRAIYRQSCGIQQITVFND